MHFIKEAEYKYNIRDKNYEAKIMDFFECFKLLENVSDNIIPKTEFLKDSDVESSSDSSED